MMEQEKSFLILHDKNRAFVRKYDLSKKVFVGESILQLDDIEQDEIGLVLYEDFLINEDNVSDFLNKNEKYFPVLPLSNVPDQLKESSFEDTEEMINLYTDFVSKWVLFNNLNTLDNLFLILENLKEISANERNLFYEELWYLLKMNLGANFIKIIYNDLDGDDGKNKLKVTTVEGSNSGPETQVATEAEKKMIEMYAPKCVSPFQLYEVNEEKGEMFILGMIDGGPVLVMAKKDSFSQLESTVTKLIFQGMASRH